MTNQINLMKVLVKLISVTNRLWLKEQFAIETGKSLVLNCFKLRQLLFSFQLLNTFLIILEAVDDDDGDWILAFKTSRGYDFYEQLYNEQTSKQPTNTFFNFSQI